MIRKHIYSRDHMESFAAAPRWFHFLACACWGNTFATFLAKAPRGVVKDGVQWSEGDSWPIGERAEGAGTVGGVEREG